MTGENQGAVIYAPTEDYFKVLFSSILTSLILLVGTHIALTRGFGNLPSWLSVVAGVTPLIFYHLVYLAPRAKRGISQTAIDSVYYFGFLITVAALGISAVSIAQSSGALDTKPVVYQFGVGLFATGYAVIARMHLSSISKMLDEASPEAIIDKYIIRSRALVDNVEMAVVSMSQIAEKSEGALNQLDALSSSIIKRTEESMQRTQAIANQAVTSAAKTFENEMSSTIATSKQALLDIRGLMAESSFIEERKSLVATLKATIETTTQVNQSLLEFNRAALSSATAANTVSQSQKAVGEALGAFGASVEILIGKEGPLHDASRQLVASSIEVSTGASHLVESVTKMNSATQQLSDGASGQLKLNKILKRAEEQLSGLAGVTERFSSVIEHTMQSADTGAKTITELNRVAEALPLLATKVVELSHSFEAASTSYAGLATSANQLPSELEQTRLQLYSVTQLVQQLAATSNEVATAGGAIQDDLKNSMVVTEAAKRLIETSERLSATLQAIDTSMTKLPVSLQFVENSLSQSAKTIRETIETSVKTLENDVQRSSAAASLLTTSLVDVAENIVSRTRAHQGMPS